MINDLKWWWKEKRLRRTYEPELHRLNNAKQDKEFDRLMSEYSHERQLLAEDQRARDQHRLTVQAKRLFLPIPSFKESGEGDTWRKGLYGEYLMTDKAMRELSREVREELKARRDFAFGWISPFSGIIGTIVGFVLGQLSR